jgi:hypothetical protein
MGAGWLSRVRNMMTCARDCRVSDARAAVTWEGRACRAVFLPANDANIRESARSK